jgi:DNA-binding winged helix-turn-helix (wHTH) protein/tetratricopeptide (TPR) repeat protein
MPDQWNSFAPELYSELKILRLNPAPTESTRNGYRFHGVELAAENQLLRVDGHDRRCSSKAFALLELLCRAGGKLVTRDEVLESLWPGGQVISEVALSQAIFRARTAIGPYGDHIQTIRGKGLRLDGEVVRARVEPSRGVTTLKPNLRELKVAHAAAPAKADGPASSLPERMSGSKTKPASRWLLLSVFTLLVCTAGYLALRSGIENKKDIIDVGYGLYFGDLHAEDPETPGMLVEAFKSDSIGERQRGVLLLEAVHEKDTSTPIPALFLALWAQGGGDIERAEEWLRRANQRIESDASIYLKLLRDYITAETHGIPQENIDQAGALLDIRPDAWRMHYARAHLMELLGMREAALAEMQQIEVTEYGNRKLESVIADRASFGDVAGALAMLNRLGPASSPAVFAFLNGRIAWSRADMPGALDFFESAVDLAFDSGRLDIHRRALIYAGALLALAGENQRAIERLEQARSAAVNRSIIDEIDITLLLAQLYAEGGDIQGMNAELDRALAPAFDSESDHIPVARAIVSLRLRAAPIPPKPQAMLPEYAALLRAMEAWSGGENDMAKAALAEAQALGIHNSRLSDEARWLELQLGLPVANEAKLDPPYPPISRVVLRRQIQQLLVP